MTCNKCGKNVVECDCPDMDDRLESLRSSPYVYVENVIEERAKRKLQKLQDLHKT